MYPETWSDYIRMADPPDKPSPAEYAPDVPLAGCAKCGATDLPDIGHEPCSGADHAHIPGVVNLTRRGRTLTWTYADGEADAETTYDTLYDAVMAFELSASWPGWVHHDKPFTADELRRQQGKDE